MKKVNVINSAVFITFLAMFGIINILSPIRTFSEMENRYLAQIPNLNFRNLRLGRVTTGMENFLSDQFFLRDKWVLLKSDIELFTMKRENNGIFIGKDGFLLENYKGPRDNLYKNINSINNLYALLPNKDFYFLGVPNSVEIFPHKLPPLANPQGQGKVIEIIESNLSGDIRFINITETMRTNNHEYIYFKTDHHWTMEGAYFAYRYAGSFLGYNPYDFDDFRKDLVSDDFYGTYFSKANNRSTPPDKLFVLTPNFPVKYQVRYSGKEEAFDKLYSSKHLEGRDKYSFFLDGNHPLVTISSDIENNKKILVIKDSYAHSFVPFLANHYSEIHMIDLRYFNTSLTDYIESNMIDEVLFLFNISTFSQDGNILNFIP